ncbi:siderophore-mediated iron transport protein [Reticulomyxa filosa]|uniref:Siderophore-mediated iron transport protein n=1 Tax=Reticulomyxa filosa TaxID=46433 RepID=X6LAM7_RETFI|nr:siderophore-mediated iron transport protein [Reticulomyxa filosa]|eukprot:ETN99082.1 siderophore-mediated iron transport protein [Reticulomyxa filosa]
MGSNDLKWWGYEVMRAEVLSRLELRSDKAVACMAKAKEKYGGDADKCYYYASRYGLLHLAYGQHAKALEWCQKASALFPNAFIRVKVIECMMKLKQMDTASQELKRLLQDVKKGWNGNRVTNKQAQSGLIGNVDAYGEKECQFVQEWFDYIKTGYGQKHFENIIKLTDDIGNVEKSADWKPWSAWRGQMEEPVRFQILPLHTSIAVFHEHFVSRKQPLTSALFNAYMSTISGLSKKDEFMGKGLFVYELVLAQAMMCWAGTAVFTDDYSMHPTPMQLRNFMLATKDDLNAERCVILRYVMLFDALLVKRAPGPLEQLFINDASSVPQFEGIFYDLCNIGGVTADSSAVLKAILEESKKSMPILNRETEWLVFSANVKRMTDDSGNQENFEFVFGTFSKLLVKTNGKDKLSLAVFGDYLLGINRARAAIVFFAEALRLYPELRSPENMAVLSKYGFALTCASMREYMYTASRILQPIHANNPSKAGEWKDSSKATDLADVRDTAWKAEMEVLEPSQFANFASRANPVTASGIMTYLQLNMLNLYEARVAYFQTEKGEKRGNKWCLIANVLLNIVTGAVDNKAMKECADALKRTCGENAASSSVWNAAQAMFEATVALGKKGPMESKKGPQSDSLSEEVSGSKEAADGAIPPHEYAVALLIGLCAARWCSLGPMQRLDQGKAHRKMQHADPFAAETWSWTARDQTGLGGGRHYMSDFDSLAPQAKFLELSFEGKINDALEKSKTSEGPYLEEKKEEKKEKSEPKPKPEPTKTPVPKETKTPEPTPKKSDPEPEPASKAEKHEESSSLKAVSKPDQNAYKKVPLEELLKWATECENTVKSMRAEGKDKIKSWDVNKTGAFVASLPFYGHSDYYKSLILKHNVDGTKLLGADLKTLEEWGFDHLAHRARLYKKKSDFFFKNFLKCALPLFFFFILFVVLCFLKTLCPCCFFLHFNSIVRAISFFEL